MTTQSPDLKHGDVTYAKKVKFCKPNKKNKQKKKNKTPSASAKTHKPKNISSELDNFLREVAKSWRTLRRSNDRDTATLMLQLALVSIPRRSGRVAEWLGPAYFDEELPITRGCQVRILTLTLTLTLNPNPKPRYVFCVRPTAQNSVMPTSTPKW